MPRKKTARRVQMGITSGKMAEVAVMMIDSRIAMVEEFTAIFSPGCDRERYKEELKLLRLARGAVEDLRAHYIKGRGEE